MRVLILSRKDLGPVTRVSRQADALARAGHQVTVVSLKKPAESTIEAASGVQYIEVSLGLWSRPRIVAMRVAHKQRLLAACHEARGKERDNSRDRRPTRPVVRLWLRDRLAPLFVAKRKAVLLSTPEQGLRQRIKQLAFRGLPTSLELYAQAVAQIIASTSFANKTSAVLLGQRFDVVQAHDNYALVAARRLADQNDADLIYDAVEIAEHRIAVRESSLERVLQRCQRRREARIFRGAEQVITVGDGLADWYAQRYGIERPLPIRNCRWYWPYRPREDVRRDCDLASGDKLVIWFGYGYPAQGLETIVEAAGCTPGHIHFALVTAVLPRWEPFIAHLKERTTELNLDGRMHFLEPQTPANLVAYASGADLGIIPRPNVGPNIYYSMPNKLMEMIMARLPVAVSDLADIRALVERYELGRFFDVHDVGDIARTLVEMLEPSLYAYLHERVMSAAEVLCWENESQRYLELFRPAGGDRDLAS